jgi:excisionase family DNA binding protein
VTEVLTVSEAVHVLDVAAQTVRDWADTGKLPALRTGTGQRIFRRSDVETMQEQRSSHKDK